MFAQNENIVAQLRSELALQIHKDPTQEMTLEEVDIGTGLMGCVILTITDRFGRRKRKRMLLNVICNLKADLICNYSQKDMVSRLQGRLRVLNQMRYHAMQLTLLCRQRTSYLNL